MRIGTFDMALMQPDTNLQTAVSSALLVGGALVADTAGATPAVSFACGVGALAIGWLARQARTAWARDNCLMASDLDAWQAPEAAGINSDVTDRLRKATGNNKLTAVETRSAQYRLLSVANDDPSEVAKALPRVASVLGVAPDALGWIPTAGRDLSVILAPLDRTEWETVLFDADALQPGKLVGYVGQDVMGKPVTYDRKDSPHMLISGTTGAGKTEAIRADMHSMRLSGLNPEIHIIDAKATLRREQCASFTSDMQKALQVLTDINQRARERMNEIVAAGFDNWFQFRKQCPDVCPAPIFVYIDEYPQFRALAGKDDVEALVGEILRVHRSAGVFLTIGIQKPKATELPTEMRDMLDVRLAMRVPDSKASLVAVDDVGAEGLPGEGAFMFRVGGSAIVRGRGAFMAGA